MTNFLCAVRSLLMSAVYILLLVAGFALCVILFGILLKAFLWVGIKVLELFLFSLMI